MRCKAQTQTMFDSDQAVNATSRSSRSSSPKWNVRVAMLHMATQQLMVTWQFFRLAALLLLACSGCSETQPDSDLTVETDTKQHRIAEGPIRVSAEDWSAFTWEGPKKSIGWIALPEHVSDSEYHSATNPQALGILGPVDCLDCHAEHVHGFHATAHARTAQIATPQSVLGPLTAPGNILRTALSGFMFETVSHRDEIIHRLTYHEDGADRTLEIPLAFTMGSGNHGQSFLAWHGDQLCQTPVSYLSEAGRWSNSPGTYIDGTADFSRPATARCLDCHNTWFAQSPGSINRYDKTQWILGVTCVRCHGNARDHVKYHRLYPDDPNPQAIVNPRNLSRDRANEVCSQCHSGGGDPLRPAFTYRPGEPLSQWILINLDANDSSNDDPHSANQLGRLMRSRCYQASGTLACMDCHDLHRQERGRQAHFSNLCQSCHQVHDCRLANRYTHDTLRFESRCVECHMPSRRDRHVTSQSATGAFMPLLRDHQIGIWREVSDSIEKHWNRENLE